MSKGNKTMMVLVVLLLAVFIAGYWRGSAEDRITMQYMMNVDYTDKMYEMTEQCVDRNPKSGMTEIERTDLWIMCHSEYLRMLMEVREGNIQ